MANMSIEHGNCDASSLGFAELSMVLSRLGDRGLGFRIGRVGLRLLERPELRRFACRVFVVVGYHITPWTDPLRTSQTLLRRALAIALESGDQTFRLYSLVHIVSLALATGAAPGRRCSARPRRPWPPKQGQPRAGHPGPARATGADRGPSRAAPSAVASVRQLEEPGGLVIAGVLLLDPSTASGRAVRR